MGLNANDRESTSVAPVVAQASSLASSSPESEEYGDGEEEEGVILRKSPPLASAHRSQSPTLLVTTLNEFDPVTQRLLRLYVDRTSILLLSTPPNPSNPFVRHVIPLAFSDPLIMNVVLAVGGFPWYAGEDNRKVEALRLRYYGDAIRGLKLALTDWSTGRNRDAVRLLLATILLCLHECIRGNEGGTLFQHLRASRQFAQAVLAKHQDDYASDLVGVLLEAYAYYELCSSMRLLPEHNDIDAACQLSSLWAEKISLYRTFGSLFGSLFALYKVIPFVCQLAKDRKVEIVQRTDMGCYATFTRLRHMLQAWNGADGVYNNYNNKPDAEAAAENVVRNSLLLFLYSSYYHDTEFLRHVSQSLVDESIESLSVAAKTTWIHPTFWSMVVIATHATTAEQQAKLMALMPTEIPLVTRAMGILKWIWEESEDIFGLDGLVMFTKAHRTTILFG
ncbi:hypothetical protein LTR67_008049 [Exophiala xenobiotica]